MKKTILILLTTVITMISVTIFSTCSDPEILYPIDTNTTHNVSHNEETPSLQPDEVPSQQPNETPSQQPDETPSQQPDETPSQQPDETPSQQPDEVLSQQPDETPSQQPNETPSQQPNETPSQQPNETPSQQPDETPSQQPNEALSQQPNKAPSQQPNETPSQQPDETPSQQPDENIAHKEKTPPPTPSKRWHVSSIAMISDVQFNEPSGIAITSDGTILYITDTINHRIRKISLTNNEVTTIAGSTRGYKNGNDTNTQFNKPSRIAITSDSATLYVTDTKNHRIRKISLIDNEVTTIAGDGTAGYKNETGTKAQFNEPGGIAITSDDNTLYVTDTNNHRIRKISLIDNEVTTIAGNGTAGYQNGNGTNTQLSFPNELVITSDDNTLYVADTHNHRIRKINLTDNEVTTIAGNGTAGYKNGNGTNTQFHWPMGLAITSDDNTLYVTDTHNHRIRKINLTDNEVITIAGNGTAGYKNGNGTNTQFKLPKDMAVSSDGATLYVADLWNNSIRKLEYK